MKISIPVIMLCVTASLATAQTSTTLIATGATWRYLVASSAPASSWKTDVNFNDASVPWYGGPSPLGYGGQGTGSPPITSEGGTCVDQCVSGTPPSCFTCTNKEITTYFRKVVSVSNAAASGFALRYQRDDGIVIYINGVERVRENLPNAPATISHSTTATAIPTDAEELVWKIVTVEPGWLQDGQNLIAAEIHQNSPVSSDIRFNMELRRQGPIVTRGPYLQLGTQTAATVRWRTDVPCLGRVTYGLSAGNLTGAVSETATTTEHEIRVTGLTPDQQYFYSIGTTSDVLEQGTNYYFLTAPLPDTKRKIRIASFGDCGNNIIENNQINVRDGFLTYRGNTPTDLWMLIGDNSYDGNDDQYQVNFFDPYRTSLLPNSMLFPIPGNHDYYVYPSGGPVIPYFNNFTLPKAAEAGGVPSGTEEWYSFDYGPIHFVMLDGYGTRTINGVEKRFYADTINHPQTIWLKQDLAATTKKWKIVYMHYPPYSLGSHSSEAEQELIDLRRYINPIFERFGVDLVLTGHSHGYERSFPIHDQYGPMSDFTNNPAAYRYPGDESTGRYDGEPNSCAYKNTSEKKKQGTVYVVSGSAGALEPSNRPKHAVMATDLDIRYKGGSFYMDVEDNRLDAKFLQASTKTANPPGSYSVTDQFTIMKDVDVIQTLTITAGQPTTLTASFISDYAWSNPANNTFTASSRSVVVSPVVSQTFVVKDGKQCIQDVYIVQVNCTGLLYSVKDGNWNDPTVWSCSRVPNATDLVQVRHNLLVPANVQARALNVQFESGRKLTYGTNARLLLSQ